MISPLFVSHGSPSLLLEDTPVRTFLSTLGQATGRPRAIVVASAHWTTREPTVGANPDPGTIHDFGGFPDVLYRIEYPADGEPGLAETIADALNKEGIATRIDPERGLDHGAWVPLSLMYPEADIPVVPIAVQPRTTPKHHYEMGRALRWLAQEDILLLATGNLTHNLYELRAPGSATPAWVTDFAEWFHEKLTAGDIDALLDYRHLAPEAARNHPTDEHLLPLYVALGTGGDNAHVERLHDSHTYGILAMDAYAFHIGQGIQSRTNTG